MRFGARSLLVLVAILAGLAACAENSAPAPNTAVSPEGTAVALVPYTSAGLGISGVAPEGWQEMKPGQFFRDMPGEPTFLG